MTWWRMLKITSGRHGENRARRADFMSSAAKSAVVELSAIVETRGFDALSIQLVA